MTVIYVLLVAHFVGDFLCQTDWMATNKSKRWDALALHVLVYTFVLALFTVRLPADVSLFLAVNMGAHFVQDAITSLINARLWFVDGVRAKHAWRGATIRSLADGALIDGLSNTVYEVAYNNKRYWFFVAIGADQLLHYVTLFVTASWWLT